MLVSLRVTTFVESGDRRCALQICKLSLIHIYVTFDMQPGEMMAIVGSSGSGKSTLLHLLGGLDSPTFGEVIFKGQSLNEMSSTAKAELRNRELGFIYQFHHLLPDFSALENVMMPLLIGGKKGEDAQGKEMCIRDRAHTVF